MTVILRSALTLQRLIEGTKELVHEANFSFDATGITMQAMDASHVALVSIRMDPKAFVAYACPTPTVVGVHLGNLHKILSCIDKTHQLTLRLATDTLELDACDEGGTRTAHFELHLMELDSEGLTIPDMPFVMACHMATDDFQRIVRDVAQLGDTVEMRAMPTALTLSVNGETGRGRIRLGESDGFRIISRGAVDLNLAFATRYLALFCKTALTPNVKIELSSDLPLRITYDDAGVAVCFYLAPKMDGA